MPEPLTAISAYGIAGNFDGEAVGFLAVTATGAGLAADTMEFVSDVVAHEVDVADAPDYVRITAVGSVDTVGDNQVLGPAPAVTPTLNLLGAPSVGGFWLYDPTTGVDATMAVLGFLPQTAAAGLATHTVNAPDGWVRWRKQPIELEQRVTSLEDRTVPDAADGDPDQVWTTDGAAGSWQDLPASGISLVGHFQLPVVAGQADVAAAVAAGYFALSLMLDEDVELLMPDPDADPPFSLIVSDEVGGHNLTFTPDIFAEVQEAAVNLANDPAVLWWLGFEPVPDISGTLWSFTTKFGADQIIPPSTVGAANGVAPLGADGKVPAENLPGLLYDSTSASYSGATVTIPSDPAGVIYGWGAGEPGTPTTVIDIPAVPADLTQPAFYVQVPSHTANRTLEIQVASSPQSAPRRYVTVPATGTDASASNIDPLIMVYPVETGYLIYAWAAKCIAPVGEALSSYAALTSLSAFTAPTADLPIGGNKLTGVDPGTASTDAVNLSQLDNTGATGISVDAPPGPNYWSHQSASSSATAPSSEMYLFPLTWRGLTLARLAMRCDTLEAGSEARLGIWDLTGVNRGSITAGQGALLEDVGLLSGAATGWVRATPTYGLLDHGGPPLGLSVSFSTHTTVRWKRVTTMNHSLLGWATAYNEGYFGWKATGVSHMGGLPSTLPAMTMYSDGGAGARTPFVGPEFT